MSEPRLGGAMDVRFGATAEEFLATLTDLGLNHIEFKREYLAGHPEAPEPATVRELAEAYDATVTYHAPFRDWNLGSFNESVRAVSAEMVKDTLDDAADAGANAVVVHGGAVPHRYPSWVKEQALDNAIRSLAECAAHAADVGVPLCLENQPMNPDKQRYTTSPDALTETLAAVDADPDYLKVTLDVGHARVNGHDVTAFVERFGDRIEVCHLHDNDGSADQHEPLTNYEPLLEHVPAEYFVFEMKAVDDVRTCVGEPPAADAGSATDD